MAEFPQPNSAQLNKEDFAEDYLSILIKQCFGADFSDIKNKEQIKNIVTQLKICGANTIICEREYIDRDFSEDYTNYYVQGFKNYRGSCARLHFFKEKFSHEDFSKILFETKVNDSKILKLQETYLGFIVIKPLPFTFLGRTCIKKPDHVKISRKYPVNLFGIALEIETIAFQEQDRVVSACATTAVWSLLHALPEIHNKQVPSPSAITLAAIGAPMQNVNGFPNAGLNSTQITFALESLKLRQHSFEIKDFDLKIDREFFVEFISTYLHSKIPVFIGAQVYKKIPSLQGDGFVWKGDHAVVLIGFEQDEQGRFCITLHDDRLGPFLSAPLTTEKIFLPNDLAQNSKERYGFALPNNEFLIPTSCLVATYHKKKIGADLICNTAKLLLKGLQSFYVPFSNLSDEENDKLRKISYTSVLTECHSIKVGYFNTVRNHSVCNALVAHFPHFIWQIQFQLNGKPLIDFLFDATSAPNGNPYLCYVVLDDNDGELLLYGLQMLAKQARLKNQLDNLNRSANDDMSYSYYLNVLRKLAPQPMIHSEFLDTYYGPLRPPKYLRDIKFSNFPEHIEVGDPHNRHRIYSSLEIPNFDLITFMKKLPADSDGIAIWVIDEEGALLFGPDEGHPNLTGAKPARIAGELKINTEDQIVINANSGRYSKHRLHSDVAKYLNNAIKKWREIFPDITFVIETSLPASNLH